MLPCVYMLLQDRSLQPSSVWLDNICMWTIAWESYFQKNNKMCQIGKLKRSTETQTQNLFSSHSRYRMFYSGAVSKLWNTVMPIENLSSVFKTLCTLIIGPMSRYCVSSGDPVLCAISGAVPSMHWPWTVNLEHYSHIQPAFIYKSRGWFSCCWN